MEIKNIINHHINLIKNVEDQFPLIKKISENLIQAIKNGNKIFFMGNGGSAADSQHLAAELTGRFQKNRKALPAIALTTDTSAITAIGNDFSFDDIFKRQIQGLAVENDAVIGISTSGNSKNIISAIIEAEKKKCYTISLTGNNGGKLKEISKESIIVPSQITARIQEAHILIGHIICELIEEAFSD
ncbi:MAG: phosphoheptose isomerase [Deltaproteobacteria bacterium]|nr:MAG: phosphoheptose isomerase [Deltaproteobacteria bacterium]PIE75035.1 MAG: phosphoheptose isomerase [Deltaproteobacteria bacterium]